MSGHVRTWPDNFWVFLQNNPENGQMKKKQGVIGVICLFAVWFFCCGGAAQADVIINEVMASNGYYESGHAWDWVELYNNGDRTENLSGWGFTDSKKDLYKFTFPDGAKLKAGEYLVIWTSDNGEDEMLSIELDEELYQELAKNYLQHMEVPATHYAEVDQYWIRQRFERGEE